MKVTFLSIMTAQVTYGLRLVSAAIELRWKFPVISQKVQIISD